MVVVQRHQTEGAFTQMIPNSSFVAGLKPATEYTVNEIAEITGITRATVYSRIKALVKARYLKEASRKAIGEGPPSKTYVLDIAAGAGWTTRLKEDSYIESTLAHPVDAIAHMVSGQAEEQGVQTLFGWRLYLLRYIAAINGNPSTRKIDDAKSELIDSVRLMLRRLGRVIEVYSTIENAIEVNDPLSSGFFDDIEEMLTKIASEGTDIDTLISTVDQYFILKQSS